MRKNLINNQSINWVVHPPFQLYHVLEMYSILCTQEALREIVIIN